MKLLPVNCVRSIVRLIADYAVVIAATIYLSIFKVRCKCVNQALTRICSVSFIQEVATCKEHLSFKIQEQTAYIYTVKCSWTCLECALSLNYMAFIFIPCAVVPRLSVEVSAFNNCWIECNVFDINLSTVYSSWSIPVVSIVC